MRAYEEGQEPQHRTLRTRRWSEGNSEWWKKVTRHSDKHRCAAAAASRTRDTCTRLDTKGVGTSEGKSSTAMSRMEVKGLSSTTRDPKPTHHGAASEAYIWHTSPPIHMHDLCWPWPEQGNSLSMCVSCGMCAHSLATGENARGTTRERRVIGVIRVIC